MIPPRAAFESEALAAREPQVRVARRSESPASETRCMHRTECLASGARGIAGTEFFASGKVASPVRPALEEKSAEARHRTIFTNAVHSIGMEKFGSECPGEKKRGLLLGIRNPQSRVPLARPRRDRTMGSSILASLSEAGGNDPYHPMNGPLPPHSPADMDRVGTRPMPMPEASQWPKFSSGRKNLALHFHRVGAGAHWSSALHFASSKSMWESLSLIGTDPNPSPFLNQLRNASSGSVSRIGTRAAARFTLEISPAGRLVPRRAVSHNYFSAIHPCKKQPS